MSARNILFIMIDQLRWDYLSCYGSSPVQTPHIDALAARGVRFTSAYAQGTSCGNSRASFYTGRHVRSHGATWNDIPFGLDQRTLGEYMHERGLQTILMGKTHMRPDVNGLVRLHLDAEGNMGQTMAECGFVAGERDDGLHPEGPLGFYSASEPRYNEYLRAHGMDGRNPWLEWANSAQDEQGRILNGFFMENANHPARVPAEFSETAYMTGRAMQTIAEAGDKPWCLHLSYIKPHWPLIAPAPYHAMYGADDVPAAVRSQREIDEAHPVFGQFMKQRVAQTFSRDDVRARAIPAYMGLIRQVDDEIGRLMAFLKTQGRLDDTLIVLTADHGDYLGDHWLGEKDLFHDAAAKLPMIVVDPGKAADTTRGTACDALVGAIDVIPTFIDALGGTPPRHLLEGRSLLPWLCDTTPATWRDAVFSECDYARLPAAQALGRDPLEARLTMAFDGRWKYVHCLGFAPMLYDLQEDPQELRDLGRDPGPATVRERMKDLMLDWSAGLRNRAAIDEEQMRALTGKSARQGILIGFWKESDVPAAQKPQPLGTATTTSPAAANA
ncbi:sulfatase-like hydrolase/transferase [Comamonas thiooxydans]|uniref:Sulfatase-like hydrolase/transferase n=1 Tax=Comamonas thiooxydans TaxID=363952 RepID=A0AA42Q0J1_9BURK|nr:sulfatase-like hydrolase/transferase [Comamonas thiooxydans]MDH1334985.1 sulfatase-like hydrolase/transferase [Comamonas thiooxydans]MDH1741136.1 sulfatase-like hydrolase/transferase [Comamonas thiooxydans]MDH1787468.1 sulfatase-like hydrolase/transferase [Comamonas thiooxydans]